jgi:outer membrane receptor protein involved in Fe transport
VNTPDIYRCGVRHSTAVLRSSLPVILVAAIGVGWPSWLHAQNEPAAAAPTPSAAQDEGDLPNLELEDLLNVKVYAASKFVQDVAQAPASVTIVTADEIRRHGYRTLADILRSVRGFYIAYDRNYSYVGVRGFLRPGDYNSRVLLQVNGHRLNEPIFEQALLGTESPIDVTLFERVEVIRGPSSSLYGTSAFFAVVNVITRSGRSIGGTEVEVEGGTQFLRRGRVSVGGKTARGFEGMLSASAHGSDGNDRIYYPEFDTPPETDGYAIQADHDRSASVFASGTAGRFRMQGGFGSRTKTIPTAPFETLFNVTTTETQDVRGFADLQYTRRADARTTVELRAAYDHYYYNGDFSYDTGMFHDDARGEWVTTEASAVRQMGAHALTVGTEYRHHFKQNQSAADDTGLLLDSHHTSDTLAVYAEDEYRVNQHVLVNAGLRWDEYFDLFGGTVNPRVALILTPFQGGTLKVLYGRAFRAPNPFELYYDQNEISAQLEPEHIQTVEVAWEQRLAPRLQVTASVFRNHVQGLISQRSGSGDTIDGLYFRNDESVTADGLELEIQGELPGRTHVRVAQVFQAAALDADGRLISNSPQVLSTLVLDAPIPHTDAVIAFDGYYIGERRRVVDGMVDGAFVGNLSITRRWTGLGLGLGLTIANVFNAQYADPGSVEHRQEALPQDGRTAAMRLSWRF